MQISAAPRAAADAGCASPVGDAPNPAAAALCCLLPHRSRRRCSRPPAARRHHRTQVLQRLAESPSAAAARHFGAFYSSELGGIVTEPGFMVVGIDDHMAQHGDAVTDALHLVSGYLYQLDEHLARLSASADMAGLPLPMSEARLRRVLLDTAAASLKQNGAARDRRSCPHESTAASAASTPHGSAQVAAAPGRATAASPPRPC